MSAIVIEIMSIDWLRVMSATGTDRSWRARALGPGCTSPDSTYDGKNMTGTGKPRKTSGKPKSEAVTEPGNAEVALRASEARYRLIFENSNDAILLASSNGRHHDANAAACRLFGWPKDELVLACRADLFDQSDPRLAPAIEVHSRTGGFRGELTAVRRDGTRFPVEVSATSYHDRLGQEYTSVFIRDITDRKRAEREMIDLNFRLAHRARELEEANREMETFSHSVSHDLRKPLTAIDGYSQLILEKWRDRLDGRCEGFVREIHRGALRMNQLIESLLVFTRMSSQCLSRERVDLSDLARVIVTDLRLSDPERWVEFRIEEGMRVNGDLKLLRVLLQNLIGNAWKYSSARKRATIEFRKILSGRGEAFAVSDNGVGFAMADVEDLFVPFKRLDGWTDPSGHGLGLATAKRIVEKHGGEIWAEGKPGRGAVFYFTL
jgi:PAS domain S-box-containing protein